VNETWQVAMPERFQPLMKGCGELPETVPLVQLADAAPPVARPMAPLQLMEVEEWLPGPVRLSICPVSRIC